MATPLPPPPEWYAVAHTKVESLRAIASNTALAREERQKVYILANVLNAGLGRVYADGTPIVKRLLELIEAGHTQVKGMYLIDPHNAERGKRLHRAFEKEIALALTFEEASQ